MVCSRTWYTYQHFLFDFPFDEIYRRLLFFTLERMYQIRIYVWYLCYVPDTYVLRISRQKSIRTYVMFRPWTHTSDVGPKEACTGLTFVCLSRAKRLVDLMVEPMSFDRIGNLGNSTTMKARLQEEVRLVALAQSTRVRYTDMGVFSAVAGN